MAKAQSAESFVSLDEVRDYVTTACDGWGSVIRCSECKQVVAVIFKDFGGDDGNMWYGGAHENPVTCEDCRHDN
jgi:hypothetical protein